MYLAKYAGGKFYARKQIFDILKSESITACDDWLEPFVGAGSILFKAMQEKIAKNYYANDLNFDLINTYKNFNNENIEKFLALGNEYLQLNNKDAIYNFFKTMLNKYNNAAIKESYMFLFLLNFCYGGSVKYTNNKKLYLSVNYNVLTNDMSFFLINRKKMYDNILNLLQDSKADFFNYDYKDFLARFINDNHKQVIFLDPPYESGSVAYNADKIGTYDSRAFLHAFKTFKNDSNTLLITIRTNDSDVFDIFKKYDVKLYKLNVDKRINYKYDKKEKINDCLIIVR